MASGKWLPQGQEQNSWSSGTMVHTAQQYPDSATGKPSFQGPIEPDKILARTFLTLSVRLEQITAWRGWLLLRNIDSVRCIVQLFVESRLFLMSAKQSCHTSAKMRANDSIVPCNMLTALGQFNTPYNLKHYEAHSRFT